MNSRKNAVDRVKPSKSKNNFLSDLENIKIRMPSALKGSGIQVVWVQDSSGNVRVGVTDNVIKVGTLDDIKRLARLPSFKNELDQEVVKVAKREDAAKILYNCQSDKSKPTRQKESFHPEAIKSIAIQKNIENNIQLLNEYKTSYCADNDCYSVIIDTLVDQIRRGSNARTEFVKSLSDINNQKESLRDFLLKNGCAKWVYDRYCDQRIIEIPSVVSRLFFTVKRERTFTLSVEELRTVSITSALKPLLINMVPFIDLFSKFDDLKKVEPALKAADDFSAEMYSVKFPVIPFCDFKQNIQPMGAVSYRNIKSLEVLGTVIESVYGLTRASTNQFIGQDEDAYAFIFSQPQFDYDSGKISEQLTSKENQQYIFNDSWRNRAAELIKSCVPIRQKNLNPLLTYFSNYVWKKEVEEKEDIPPTPSRGLETVIHNQVDEKEYLVFKEVPSVKKLLTVKLKDYNFPPQTPLTKEAMEYAPYLTDKKDPYYKYRNVLKAYLQSFEFASLQKVAAKQLFMITRERPKISSMLAAPKDKEKLLFVDEDFVDDDDLSINDNDIQDD